jgi:isoprenylcysteine carboxyl methyltransferase (ICMT) family protein YpbQ
VLGRFLFRWRGVIGVVVFGVVFWLARPTFGSCLLGVPFLLAGLAVRFWASGYIGIEGRVREIGAGQRLASGPYRLLRHPLYIGNFLLVVSMLVALRPALWLSAAVLIGFIVEYTLIVMAEEAGLAKVGLKSQAKSQEPKGKTAEESYGRSQKSEACPERSLLRWRRHTAPPGEISRLVGLARNDRTARRVERGRGQNADVGTSQETVANGGGREATGESFLLSRALVEWRTWVVTGAAWGLALVRAAVRS